MSRPYRVLVADDDRMSRGILVGSLRKAGYATLEAVDGTEAESRAVAEAPDLVLLDVSMPGKDGFSVCEALRGQTATAEIPVIFITGNSDPHSIERAFAVGGSDYVTKPFHMGEIKARVSVHLQLRRARRELEESHERELRSQKLESIGRLAAGIAHEINTPMQYVSDNSRFLEESFGRLSPLMKLAGRLADAVLAGDPAEVLGAQLRAACLQADLDFLAEEIPRALRQSEEGIARVSEIVRAMKEFSHPGTKGVSELDLNRALASTVTVARGEWKHVAEILTDFDPELPLLPCHAAEINQVFLNILVNAAQAVAELVEHGSVAKGKIEIRTRRIGDEVEVRFRDTGPGIPPDVRGRIFDPFFTTKGVGKGTGQGLSIAHGIVAEHGGSIDFETEVGKGTTFVIRLPWTRESVSCS